MKVGLAEPWAYLAVGVATAIGGGLVGMAGLSRLSAKALTPHETMHQLERDKIAVKEMVN